MTENTVTLNTFLTKMDLRALKEADRICFHHGSDRGTIRAIKEVRNSGPFEDRERTYNIEVASMVTCYSDDSYSPSSTRCFCVTYLRDGGVWTALSLLEVGDEIRLRWVGANDNQYLKEAGLHHDALYLVVRRGKKEPMVFWIDSSICPDNTARMVKPHGV